MSFVIGRGNDAPRRRPGYRFHPAVLRRRREHPGKLVHLCCVFAICGWLQTFVIPARSPKPSCQRILMAIHAKPARKW